MVATPAAIATVKALTMADTGHRRTIPAAEQKWMRGSQMIDVRYSVYNAKTDMPIIIAGTIPQCAKVLGLTIASFQSQASKQRHGRGKDGSKRKWRIIRDEEETHDGGN